MHYIPMVSNLRHQREIDVSFRRFYKQRFVHVRLAPNKHRATTQPPSLQDRNNPLHEGDANL
jgi:hypothetical protein